MKIPGSPWHAHKDPDDPAALCPPSPGRFSDSGTWFHDRSPSIIAPECISPAGPADSRKPPAFDLRTPESRFLQTGGKSPSRIPEDPRRPARFPDSGILLSLPAEESRLRQIPPPPPESLPGSGGCFHRFHGTAGKDTGKSRAPARPAPDGSETGSAGASKRRPPSGSRFPCGPPARLILKPSSGSCQTDPSLSPTRKGAPDPSP